MALFEYEAVDEKGRKTRGVVDAESLQDAKQKLIRRQVFVTKVDALKNSKIGSRLKTKDILVLTRELARLLEAGLPLFEALSVLEEKYRNHAFHTLLLDLCDQIRSGQPLSKALAHYPSCFDLLYCTMVANAEQGGYLVQALRDLAQLLEKQLHVRKAITTALLYPALLTSFCFVVLCVLLFFVIPSLFELFEGRNLHPFTTFVFACSRTAIRAKWILGFGGLACIGGGFSLLTSNRGRHWVREKILFQLPLISDLFTKAALARFFRSTGTLIDAGVPALSALSQANATLRHSMIEQSINEAIQLLAQGETLQNALSDRAGIPSLVPRLLGIAQEGGKLSSMMVQIASLYEEDLEKSIQQFTSLAQPILLLLLGGIVGFVLLSVLLPLTDVSSFSA